MKCGAGGPGWRRRDWGLVGLMLALVACGADKPPEPTGNGSISGQVVVSGPLKGAKISVEQIDTKDPMGGNRAHVGDTTTDDQGHFTLDVGIYNGLLLVTASGGQYTDLASGATITLDASAKLNAPVALDLLETRDDVLVSPVSHLIEARMREKLATYGDVMMAEADAEEHLDHHFGDVHWLKLKLQTLDTQATSPTEGVRAALVQAAFSYLTADIAAMAGASAQEVNVYTLIQAFATDLSDAAHPTFDGNDGNSMNAGGIQVGVCAPLAGCVVPTAGCTVGACRPLCDVYAGTPRALLASAISKVAALPINKTGLTPADILPVARTISDNVDDDLFAACVETLDRSPPTIFFDSPTPADGTYQRGKQLQVQVRAVDDTDPTPHVSFVGYTDADGDPNNSVAQAVIDTTQLSDGPLMIEADATDMANNHASVMRMFIVDNTAPTLTLDNTGFYVAGSTWWTKDAAPTLTGTITDVAPASIKATIGGVDYAGTITGSTWSISIPTGTLDLAGQQIVVTAADVAGNTSTLGQLVRYDATPPTVALDPSLIFDEANDGMTFASDETPVHQRGGMKVDLNTTLPACATFSLYTYLAYAAPPAYGTESERNPIVYHVNTSDDGVGLVSNQSQYRVGVRNASGVTTWIVDWTSDGTGVPSGASVAYAISLYADQVTGLAAHDATYDVEFKSVDKLQRTTTLKKCFAVKLLTPPLRFGLSATDVTGNPRPVTAGTKSYVYGDAGATAATSHPYALLSFGLGSTGSVHTIAQSLINDATHGASVFDMPFVNGTSAPIYLTVSVTKPTKVTVKKSFRESNANISTRTVSLACGPAASLNANCDTPSGYAFYSSLETSYTPTRVDFPVRVFELDASGTPTVELPCLNGCMDSDTNFSFLIPARTGAARKFIAMTFVRQFTELAPQDGMLHTDTGPYADTSINSIPFTGKTQANVTGCTSGAVSCNATGSACTCTQQTTIKPYRALLTTTIELDGSTGAVKGNYATTYDPSATPIDRTGLRSGSNPYIWTSTQGPLP